MDDVERRSPVSSNEAVLFVTAETLGEVRRLALECGLDQSAIVRLALEMLFEKYASDEELGDAIRDVQSGDANRRS